MGGDGQHGVERLLLAVDGVDDGLARVCAHAGLDGVCVGGVDLQGQQRGALQGLDGSCNHAGLIDAG